MEKIRRIRGGWGGGGEGLYEKHIPSKKPQGISWDPGFHLRF